MLLSKLSRLSTTSRLLTASHVHGASKTRTEERKSRYCQLRRKSLTDVARRSASTAEGPRDARAMAVDYDMFKRESENVVGLSSELLNRN